MPFGFVIGVLVLGVCVACALAPPRRPPLVRNAGYMVGLVFNEVPFLAFYGLVASTALALAEGDLATPAGWLAATLAGLDAIGLAVVVERGLRARGAVDAALGFTAPHRNRLARILLAPLPGDHRVERTGNIRYGDHRRHTLDVYRSRRHSGGGPVLVYFHGGGYFSGHKRREGRPLLHRLARQGWICVSANYRLRPEAGFRDHLADAKKVVAWAHENLGGEVFVAGSSAGGHLAAHCALTPDEPALQPGFETADTSVAAAIVLYGYLGPYYGERDAPLDHATAGAPPFLVVHGDRDTLVPVEATRRFVAGLRRVSRQPVVYAELPGGQHGFDLFHSLRFEAVVDGVEAFTTWVRDTRPAPTMTR